MRKKITVFIATYNQCEFLENAILSALNQKYPKDKFEVLVIDDGSTDTTQDVLSKYEGKIRIIHQEHIGLPDTCNHGIMEAEGQYFIRLDSDDIFHPKIIFYLSSAFDTYPEIVAAYSDRILLLTDREEIVSVPENDLYSLIACGVMMRTEKLRALSGYRKTFWEEYDLFLRLSKFGAFKHVAKPLYYYRRHAYNMTSDMVLRKKGWLELIEKYGKDTIKRAGNYSQFEELKAILIG